jgi:ribose-phosphate pyrophosphokinase
MIYTIRYPEDAGRLYEEFRYPGGEVQVRLLPAQIQEVARASEIHVWATIRDGEIIALAQLTDALRTLVPPTMTLFLPYLPYGRADRRFVPGDCFGLQVFASFINAMDYDRVVTLDAHSDIARIEIEYLVNVSPKPLIESILGATDNAVLLPDAGAARYGIMTALCAGKQRDAATGKLTGFVVPKKEMFAGIKKLLIVDDICDGGGTFIGIAEALRAELGADMPELSLYVTHGIFSKGLNELEKYFKTIYTTDSFQDETSYPIQCRIRKTLVVLSSHDLMLAAAKRKGNYIDNSHMKT